MDISDQIGRALESFSPFLFKKLNETLEGAMNNQIASMIREEVAVAVQAEFIKKDSMGKDGDGKEKEVETSVLPIKHKFTYKDSMGKDGDGIGHLVKMAFLRIESPLFPWLLTSSIFE